MGVLVTPFFPNQAMGAEKEATTITSNTMTADNKERKAVFKGAVILTRGDLTVRSDVLIVRFKSKPESKANESNGSNGDGVETGGKVDRIEAKGKVIIEKATSKATCRHAVYYTDEEKIVLTGSPVAWQGGTRVSGPKMTMFLKENRSVVEGGSRVVILDQEGA